MAEFVYAGGTLAYPKSDLNPIPGGADGTKYVVAADWNEVCQALVDVRTAIKGGQYFGLEEQGATPASPAAGKVHIFTQTNGLATPNTRTQLCMLLPNGTVDVIFESSAY